jgi:PAS domain S-box-containing protein
MQSNLILVVDDTEANRYAKCRMLRQAGFEVKEAAFGQEALQIVAKERPGVVCLDVRLPDINGLEVCRRIKADPALQTMVLQMSASFVGQEDRVRGLEGGADGYLISPFEPEEFLATVRSLFRLKHVEDELRTAAAQWRVTFDAIHDGILLIDVHGTILRCNRAMVEIVEKPFQEIVGRPYVDLLARLHENNDERSFSWPPMARQETILQIKMRWFQATMHSATDTVSGQAAVCVLTDITERRRQEEEIRHLNASLEKRVEELQQSRLELHEKVTDLETFEDVVVGREIKMIEMEKEIERLTKELAKYQSSLMNRLAATE